MLYHGRTRKSACNPPCACPRLWNTSSKWEPPFDCAVSHPAIHLPGPSSAGRLKLHWETAGCASQCSSCPRAYSSEMHHVARQTISPTGSDLICWFASQIHCTVDRRDCARALHDQVPGVAPCTFCLTLSCTSCTHAHSISN